MMHLQVTKYDPKFRKFGVYEKEEWTAISDIGQVYGNQLFTASDYFGVEDAYCTTVKQLLNHTGIVTLKIFQCSARKRIHSFFTNTHFYFISDDFNDSLVSGKMCQLEDVEILVRACLREEFGCVFKGKKDSYLWFGYEYYMYFGSSIELKLDKISIPNGIFIEYCDPPDFNLKRPPRGYML
jgi:hypothetical protein